MLKEAAPGQRPLVVPMIKYTKSSMFHQVHASHMKLVIQQIAVCDC